MKQYAIIRSFLFVGPSFIFQAKSNFLIGFKDLDRIQILTNGLTFTFEQSCTLRFENNLVKNLSNQPFLLISDQLSVIKIMHNISQNNNHSKMYTTKNRFKICLNINRNTIKAKTMIFGIKCTKTFQHFLEFTLLPEMHF